jgi:hypothetical protein
MKNKVFLFSFIVLICFIEALKVRIKEDGMSTAVIQFISNMIYKANKNAMLFLQEGKSSSSEKLLLRAEAVLAKYQNDKLAFLINLTCNNLACCYKKYYLQIFFY